MKGENKDWYNKSITIRQHIVGPRWGNHHSWSYGVFEDKNNCSLYQSSSLSSLGVQLTKQSL